MSSRAEPIRAAPAATAGLLLGLVVAVLWLLVSTAAGAAADGDPEAGRDLFATHCAACHGPEAQGRGGAPAQAGATERLGTEQAARTIREGRGGMPAYGDRLDEDQIRHLVAHLEQVPPAVALEGPARSGGHMMDGRWGDMMNGWPWGIALVWVLVVLVVLVLVVVGVLLLARRAGTSGSQRTPTPPPSTAREILDQRYARGEISREEYLQARDDLEGRG